MKIKDLRQLDDTKLREQLTESRGKLLTLKFGVGSRQVKNIREIRSLRNVIARILTVLRERQTNST